MRQRRRPRPFRFRCAPALDAPVVAVVEYLAGFPCLSVTAFAFYSEPTATWLQAISCCRQTGKLDEIECCLLHALEPGRSLVFDWRVNAGFSHREDGHWLVWRSSRVA